MPPQTKERVTQGFVGTLQWCWRRPSLTALEVLWRWVYGVPALLVVWHEASKILVTTPLDYAALREMTLLDPVRTSVTLAKAAEALEPRVLAVALWLVPVLLMGWMVISSLGRTLVLRRVDPSLRARPGPRMGLQAVRLGALGTRVGVWFRCLQGAARLALTGPMGRGEEPSLVLYFALAIAVTLGLFVLWAAASGGLALAPLPAMLHETGVWGSLRTAFRLGDARMKLAEINLVMGIVKIALIVLAMVFSASPLPFEAIASREFLTWWWGGVTVWYLVASDFFHVARLVSYLGLLREA